MARKKEKVYTVPVEARSNFIYSPNSWMTTILLNSRLAVPKGWWCSLVARDRPCDVLDEGEYVVTTEILPRTSKLLRLNKPITKHKKGKNVKVLRQEFDCFLYFISKAAININWETGDIYLKKKIVKKGEAKRYSVSLGGTAQVRCVDPASMQKFFLYEWAKVNNARAEARIAQFVGELVQESLDGIKIAMPQEINELQNDACRITEGIAVELQKYGMQLDKLTISSIIFDKNVENALRQELLEKNMASDAINELGAEVSVLDQSAIRESRGSVPKVVSNDNVEVLDMTDECR